MAVLKGKMGGGLKRGENQEKEGKRLPPPPLLSRAPARASPPPSQSLPSSSATSRIHISSYPRTRTHMKTLKEFFFCQSIRKKICLWTEVKKIFFLNQIKRGLSHLLTFRSQRQRAHNETPQKTAHRRHSPFRSSRSCLRRHPLRPPREVRETAVRAAMSQVTNTHASSVSRARAL